jgi:thiol-disulfide isomerase/thioredoxin
VGAVRSYSLSLQRRSQRRPVTVYLPAARPVRAAAPARDPDIIDVKYPKLAPPVSGLDFQTGAKIDWGSLRGKPTVLAFGASWCADCCRELPALVAAAKAHPEFNFLYVVTDGPETNTQAHRWLKAEDVQFPVVHDAGPLQARYGVEALPNTWVLDEEGYFRHYVVGLGRGTLAGMLSRAASHLTVPPALAGRPDLSLLER